MKKVAALAVALLAAGATAAAAAPRLHASSLRYLGAFRLPAPLGDQQTFDYGGTAPAFDPRRHGLFIVGHDWYQLTAEVSIPRARKSKRVSKLRRARYLQGFTDATSGLINEPPSCCSTKVGGQLVYGGRLFGTVYVYYDASDSQTTSHWVRSSTSLRRGRARGLFQLAGPGAGFVSGFMAEIPRRWRKALGGSILTGNCCIPIISRTSFGPAAFALSASSLGRSHITRDRPLFYYPQQHATLGPWDGSWDPKRGKLFGGGTQIKGVVFPRNGRSILFFGTQGIGKFCYGEGTDQRSLAGKPTPDGTTWCYDPDDSSKGTHAYPYVPEVWAYDARQLRRHKKPWQVRPYATWRLRLPFGSPTIGGAAYDPHRNLIYVSQQYADGAAPVIDVFKVL
ncbi:MAG: hypothetical protein JOZ73_04115 [Solirubrobacterales bacterium]|nr:hypothetical protein [Solirubrobacterales bacterium]